ncbi:transcription factor [Ganoderma sinense ZZ0214-1]|uniref:Transcription factor n=1 Tax=Ganoderma sinense ZZ0214-1 TaxID=1077348 RepID=A0A2G8SPK4_9APHY|nr:transcription factor [Ganoderma sinense ZZ0214-1]
MYAIIPDTPTPTFPDWVGMPGTPDASASNQAWLTTRDASDSIADFEREIDDVLGVNFDEFDRTRFLCQSGMEFDWQPEFHNAFPSASSPDSYVDALSSSAYIINGPLSPTSEMTLVNSPTAAVPPELKPSTTEGALVDPQFAFFPPHLMGTGFTFQYRPWSTTSPSDMHSSMTMGRPNYDHHNGQHWPEQPLSQYEAGPARLVVTSLTAGVGLSIDSSVPTSSVDHTLPPQSPSAELQQDALAIGADQKCKRKCTGRRRFVNSAGHKDDAPRKRKRSKQSTTKQFPCPVLHCPRVFTRSHNLSEHISSVHLKERKYGCMVPGCERAYSRNFDLKKHILSKHQGQGPSPKKSKKDDMAVKVRKATKKVVQGW